MSDQDLREHWQRLQRAGHTIADVFRRAVADGADPAQLLVDACRATPERFLHVEARTNVIPSRAAVCQCDADGNVPAAAIVTGDYRLVSQVDIVWQPPDSPPICFACMYMLARFMQQTNARRQQHLERMRNAAGAQAWPPLQAQPGCPACGHAWDAHDERAVCGSCGACGHLWSEHDAVHGCRHVTEGGAHPGTCMCDRAPPPGEDRFVRPGFHVGAVTTLPDDAPEHDDDQGP